MRLNKSIIIIINNLIISTHFLFDSYNNKYCTYKYVHNGNYDYIYTYNIYYNNYQKENE